jgi:hypothetical protein
MRKQRERSGIMNVHSRSEVWLGHSKRETLREKWENDSAQPIENWSAVGRQQEEDSERGRERMTVLRPSRSGVRLGHSKRESLREGV